MWISINRQSPDIADGVKVSKDDLDVDTGEQDLMVGTVRHASDEIHSMRTCLERD